MLQPFLLALVLLPQAPAPTLTHGPFRGACDTNSMEFWARASEPGEYAFELCAPQSAAGADAWLTPVTDVANADGDLTLHWRVEGLKPDTLYPGGRIRCADANVWTNRLDAFRTSRDAASPTANVVFGSCCEERLRPEQPIWQFMQRDGSDALVLLGDTPYIDSTDLEVQRKSYREFFDFVPIRAALSSTPCYFTWDDHDYAANDQYGLVKGRENSRRAFMEYHASRQLGSDGGGIFTSFRRGPLEVFVLDTRWFADIESSPLAAGARSLLGKQQIEWLQHGLASSTAEFKILACGMVWNNAVRPNKLDCWGNWLPERDALLKWIGEQHITGLVLVGGDIHRSRVIVHPTKALLGYDVPEFISSPIAQSVIEAAKVDAPGLLFDVGAPASYLWIEASSETAGAQIRGHIMDGAGRELFAKAFRSAELSPAAAK